MSRSVESSDLPDLIEREFPSKPDRIYLNHAGISPWPKSTAAAVCRFARRNVDRPDPADLQAFQAVGSLKRRVARLIHAPSPDDIAILGSTSEGLSIISAGLLWRPGDNVVTADEEYQSNLVPWRALEREGVTTRSVRLDTPDPEGALCSALDERTRVLAVSAVQYSSGLRLDLKRLGLVCRDRGIIFCVDAAQCLGAVPVDVQAAAVDCLACSGHKWLLGPTGVALFYTRPEIRGSLVLRRYSATILDPAIGEGKLEKQIYESARRFECGVPNFAGIIGLNASLALIARVGPDRVYELLAARVGHLTDALAQLKSVELSNQQLSSQQSGIVSFRVRGQCSAAVVSRLEAYGIVATVKRNNIRVSPHFYSPMSGLDAAVAAVDRIAGRPSSWS